MSEFEPTGEQRRALEAALPLLVLAGAGTGKTTVLTRRIARTILSGEARPDQVLALTFTDKAANEMAERLAAVMGESGQSEAAREVTVSTFHSFGSLLLRENLLRLGLERSPGVLTGAASWRLMASIFDDLIFEAIEVSPNGVAGVFSSLLGFFSRCKDHLVDPDTLDAYIAHRERDLATLSTAATDALSARLAEWRDASRAYRRYEEAKRQAAMIDFGDHLFVPVRLLRGDEDLRAACRRRFRYIFVDEYQDTNHAQRALLLQLIDPATPNVMVIGDDDQAIYRWRGAVVHNILRFHEEEIFSPGQVTLAPMTLNRRSFPPILDLANRAIEGVSERHAKTLGYHPENERGEAVVGYYTAANDTAEAAWIATQIRALEPGRRDLPGKKRGYGAFAVLCRKRTLFEPVGRALEAAGVPYELIGGTGFYGRPEVRDVLSYLRVVAGSGDDVAMARVLRSARWCLAGGEIHHMGRWLDKKNGGRGRDGEERPNGARFHLIDAVRHAAEVPGLSPAARERLARLRAELERLVQSRGSLPLPDLVSAAIEVSGYSSELAARPGFDARVAHLNLAKLEHLARAFAAADASPSLAGFVEYVTYALEAGEEEDEVRPVDEGTNTVKVMTVHQAKGLEFPVVFVPGLAERIFPADRRDESQKWWQLPWELRGDRAYLPHVDYAGIGSEKDFKAAEEQQKAAEKDLQLDEERRLFYVALTRAQHALYLSRAHWYGSTVKPRAGSLFWDLVVGSDLAVNLGEEECPPLNPSSSQPADDLRPGTVGCGAEAMALLLRGEDPSDWIESRVSPGDEERWSSLRAEADSHLARLRAAPSVTPVVEPAEVETSVSALLLYLTCPRHYRYLYVDRLPLRPSPFASLGREVHRRIEELSRPAEGAPEPVEGRTRSAAMEDEAYLEPVMEELVESRSEEATVGPPRHGLEELVEQFRRSPYGRRPATYVELPFVLPLAGGTLRGRIDRLDRLPDGRWELVDFKSGASRPESMGAYMRQLGLYALAVSNTVGLPVASLSGHILFLGDGRDVVVTFDEARLQSLRQEAEAALRSIARGGFPTAGSPDGCAGCDYGHLCW